MIAMLLLSAALSGDELFPGGGEFAATVATGVPYVAIGEVAYGIGDRFAVGAMAGVTPITYGVGLRARGLVVDRAGFRLVASVPVLYYPATATLGHEPWVLTMPQLLAERPFEGGSKVHVGVGLAAATCTGAIASFFGGGHGHDAGEGFMGGVWNTATLGGSIATGSFRLFTDVTLVLHGVHLAAADWIGGPPVVLTLGIRRGL